MFWYEEEIKRLEKQRTELTFEPETLFYGSSSIRMWGTLSEDFKDFGAVNLGFGGSTLAACTWFFDRVMSSYQPKRLVLYAGDNDLGEGRHPEEVFIFFQQLAARAAKRFGELKCYYISLKPSINRWSIADRFHYTNGLIRSEIEKNMPDWHWIDVYDEMLNDNGRPVAEYYIKDGLHLSEKGYEVWKDIILKALTTT